MTDSLRTELEKAQANYQTCQKAGTMVTTAERRVKSAMTAVLRDELARDAMKAAA